MTAPIWAGKIQRQDKFLSRGSAVYLKRRCRVEEVKKKKAITMQYAKCFRLTAECAAAISFSRHLVDAWASRISGPLEVHLNPLQYLVAS